MLLRRVSARLLFMRAPLVSRVSCDFLSRLISLPLITLGGFRSLDLHITGTVPLALFLPRALNLTSEGRGVSLYLHFNLQNAK